MVSQEPKRSGPRPRRQKGSNRPTPNWSVPFLAVEKWSDISWTTPRFALHWRTARAKLTQTAAGCALSSRPAQRQENLLQAPNSVPSFRCTLRSPVGAVCSGCGGHRVAILFLFVPCLVPSVFQNDHTFSIFTGSPKMFHMTHTPSK